MMTTTVGLPREWSRGPQWASPSARRVWEPVLRAAQTAWTELEVASVTEGVRKSALVHLTANEVPRASADCAMVGLTLTVLAAQPGGMFRAAVHAPSLARRWAEVWARGDDEEVGLLLGFPACCRAFFQEHWVRRGSYDVTRAMPTLTGPWESNIMLRWLGVRLVPHLPCSGDCLATLNDARLYLAAGRRAEVDVESIERLLRLPVRYDAGGGVAVVSTPHFRFMLSTDPGSGTAARPADPAPHEDNGFSSARAMAAAHAVVASVAQRPRSALDLGCGDGALLELVSMLRDGNAGVWVGVESDSGRAARGTARRPGVAILRARIEDPSVERYLRGDFDAVLLMPGRLTEMAQPDADRVRAALKDKLLVLYAYGDQLAKHSFGLETLAWSAGLRIVGPVKSGDGVEAAKGCVR